MSYTNGLDKPSDYFNTLLWTGDGNSTRNFTGVGFQPDLHWSTCRSTTQYPQLYDSVRGANKYLTSAQTGAEFSNASSGYLTSFDSDGFSSSAGSSTHLNYNQSGETYVGWHWLASNTTASNTDGSITSTVSANTTSGFSIVSYTGTGANATVGHGLGAVPKVIIIKDRTTAYGWSVYHASLGNTAYLRLDKTDGTTTDSTFWQNTTPTSSVFSIGTSVLNNTNTDNHIAYCFAEKKAFSKFGSYTGNGNADGSFIYLGFKPAFVMVKRTSPTGESWWIWDNKRDTYNLTTHGLFANTSSAEVNFANADQMNLDLLSNGFKFRAYDGAINGSGQSYIYMAFAESPFTTSTGIPTTAR